MIEPSSIAELSDMLRSCHAEHRSLGKLSLAKINHLLAHTPSDMTATAESGMTLGSLQQALRQHGQWLPLDPPDADTLTLRELLDHDLNGPRRFGYGTARDWVIGLKAVLADGQVIQSGGNVVKNVAGYDLHKLLIGARGELGLIVEVTFKVSPVPAREQSLIARCASLQEADRLLSRILDSPVMPIALDLRRAEFLELVVGLSGTENEVAWQNGILADWANWVEGDAETLSQVDGPFAAATCERVSKPPENLFQEIERLPTTEPFIARAGNGVIYRPTLPRKASPPSDIATRIRTLFDPTQVFHLPALS